MHEFSVMTQIVDLVLDEAKRRDASKVEEVVLELGEFTMLGEEQLKFAYEVLSKDTLLDKSTLSINRVKGRLKCKCGFEGEMSPNADAAHRIIPMLECPVCKQPAEIVEGRECLVKNIRMVVPDV